MARSMEYERLVKQRSKAIADAIRLSETLGLPIVPLPSASGFLAQVGGEAPLPPAPERRLPPQHACPCRVHVQTDVYQHSRDDGAWRGT
jgi:hypothetical protein